MRRRGTRPRRVTHPFCRAKGVKRQGSPTLEPLALRLESVPVARARRPPGTPSTPSSASKGGLREILSILFRQECGTLEQGAARALGCCLAFATANTLDFRKDVPNALVIWHTSWESEPSTTENADCYSFNRSDEKREINCLSLPVLERVGSRFWSAPSQIQPTE